MRHARIALALAALALPVAATAQSDGQDQAAAPRPPEVGNLIGSVSTQTGAGVVGATVTLSAGQQTTSDANGQFQFSGVPAGTYSVGVDMRGYQSSQVSVRVSASNDAQVDFALQPVG